MSDFWIGFLAGGAFVAVASLFWTVVTARVDLR